MNAAIIYLLVQHALTLYTWSPSKGSQAAIQHQQAGTLLFKRQEPTFAMLPSLSPISVPDCSFHTCGIAVSFHVKVSYTLYATRKGYYQCSPFHEPRT